MKKIRRIQQKASTRSGLDVHEKISESILHYAIIDYVLGNCRWVQGLAWDSDTDTVDYEDEYDYRNHLIRAQLVSGEGVRDRGCEG